MNIGSCSLIKIVLLYLYMALLLSACSLPEIKKQSEIIDSLAEIRGEVNVSVKEDGPVHVVLFIKKNGYFDLVDHYYESGEGSDGVVSLESQIPLKLQAEAERIYGFNSGHASVLQDRKFIARFNTILENSLNMNATSK